MAVIYLDNNSTTPLDPRVIEAMMPWLTQKFGNAGSRTHQYGLESAALIDMARMQTAEFLNCEPSEIIFTSGATESINLALRGAMHAYRNSGRHLITVATEHKAVLDTVDSLIKEGCTATILSVDRSGKIDLEEFKNAIRKDTVLATVMMANNETGVIQDVDAIGKICRDKNILFFSDTTQAAGKVKVDVKASGMAMACISAHKIYGPKGVGALYVSRKSPRVQLTPVLTGGGQERGLRSGTLNVPGIAGLGSACEIASQEWWDDGIRLSKMRTALEQSLQETFNARINGDMRDRLPNTSNLHFPGIKAEGLITMLPRLAFSTGSACTSALPEPSHVLTAMGMESSAVKECVRLSIGRFTTPEEIECTIEMFSKIDIKNK
jgi:cysteine desulfurase